MVTIRSAVLFGLAHLCHLQAVRAVSPQEIVKDLEHLLSRGSEVVLTSDAAYAEDFTARFSESHSPSYVVGAKPQSVKDVQKLVKYASHHNVPFLATGGGHGYSWSLGRLQNGIHVDLDNFQTIEIDEGANTMTIGGAVRIGNATHDLHAVGKEFPVGMCSSVGLTGYTLGGGVGPLGGIYGTGSDNLLSAEVVTGTGEILTVSKNKHPDLFYGLRGAGFNYGVVTSLTYRIHPATNNGEVTVIDATFPAALNGSVWEAAHSLVGHQPKELSILFAIRFNETLGGMSLVGSFIFFGPQAQAVEAAKPFLGLNPLNVEVKTSTYDEFSHVALYGEVADIGPKKSINFAPLTINLYQVDVANVIKVINFMNQTLTENANLKAATLSWAQYPLDGFLQYPLESSAFPYRDVVVYFSYDGFAETTDQLPIMEQLGKEVRALLQHGSGKPDLQTYVLFSHGDEGPEAWYTSDKLPRLKQLKRKYDPKNLFSWYNPIPNKGHRESDSD